MYMQCPIYLAFHLDVFVRCRIAYNESDIARAYLKRTIMEQNMWWCFGRFLLILRKHVRIEGHELLVPAKEEMREKSRWLGVERTYLSIRARITRIARPVIAAVRKHLCSLN